MALQYRHVDLGHVVTMPEPADVLAEANRLAEATARIGTKRAKLEAELIGENAEWDAHNARQVLQRMDESRKWERYVPPAPIVEQVEAHAEPEEKPVTKRAPKAAPAE